MSKRIVQCTTLGKNGRFANSVIQYLFAKAYARHTDSTLEINQDWIGFKIFDIKENKPSCILPKTKIDEYPNGVNVDIYAYNQNQQCMDLLTKKDLREWLKFKPEIQEIFDDIATNYCPNPYAIMHKRDGDYKSQYAHMYCIPTYESYFEAHKKYTPELQLNIVSEEVGFRLSRLDGTELDFLPDFFVIMNADAIYRANSTFSWLAAEMATKPNVKVFSPRVGSLVGENFVQFVPGNEEMFLNPLRFGTNHTSMKIKD